MVVEQQAEYPGGLESMAKFLQKNVKYPAAARRMGIEGSVFVSFVVDKEGKISDPQVVKGISAECDKEAIRVVNLMPPWKPGKQNGRAVKSRFVLPIKFKLAS
jgi:protein TonB